MTSRFEQENGGMQNIPGAENDGVGETYTASASTKPSMRP